MVLGDLVMDLDWERMLANAVQASACSWCRGSNTVDEPVCPVLGRFLAAVEPDRGRPRQIVIRLYDLPIYGLAESLDSGKVTLPLISTAGGPGVVAWHPFAAAARDPVLCAASDGCSVDLRNVHGVLVTIASPRRRHSRNTGIGGEGGTYQKRSSDGGKTDDLHRRLYGVQ